MERINPRVDLAFKKIFGTVENKDILIAFINAVVSEEDQVSDLEILNPYNERSFTDDKLSILDIKAKDLCGQYYNIEVQITNEAHYDKRALYYWAKLYTEQLGKGDPYSKLRKTIGIHILNFMSVSGLKDYHNQFSIVDSATGNPYFKDFKMHTIELSKFESSMDEDFDTMVASIKTGLDRWVTFLSRANYLDKNNLPIRMKDSKIHKALEVMEEMHLNKNERDAFESRLKFLRMEESALEKVREEGFDEGVAKGREEGIESTKMQIAQKMLEQGMDPETVAQVTGVPADSL